MQFTPIFDNIVSLKAQTALCHPQALESFCQDDFQYARSFLLSYDGSEATYNTYRKEIEKLLQWSWFVHQNSVRTLKRTEIEAFIQFCQSPPIEWIGTQYFPRFMESQGQRLPHPEWRPFVAKVSKHAHRKGHRPQAQDYEPSQASIKELFPVLSSFYDFLIQENAVLLNPIDHIRQKSKFIRKRQGTAPIRRLSDLQWQHVIQVTQAMADASPEEHERSLFIMSLLFGMYLRISELVESDRWQPKMSHFYRDHDNAWWFITVGKGNKERHIAVSPSLLEALKRYRLYKGWTALPSQNEHTPLLCKHKGKGGISNTAHIRKIVQKCFDSAIDSLIQANERDEAENLMTATVHWLRHTGISNDVKIRPREHVRDDAGHSSGAITDKYIDVELKKRHESAQKKTLLPENEEY